MRARGTHRENISKNPIVIFHPFIRVNYSQNNMKRVYENKLKLILKNKYKKIFSANNHVSDALILCTHLQYFLKVLTLSLCLPLVSKVPER